MQDPHPKPPINKLLGGINHKQQQAGLPQIPAQSYHTRRPPHFNEICKIKADSHQISDHNLEVEMRMYKAQSKPREVWLHGPCNRGQIKTDRPFCSNVSNMRKWDKYFLEWSGTLGHLIQKWWGKTVWCWKRERARADVTVLRSNLPPDQQWSAMTNGHEGGQNPNRVYSPIWGASYLPFEMYLMGLWFSSTLSTLYWYE